MNVFVRVVVVLVSVASIVFGYRRPRMKQSCAETGDTAVSLNNSLLSSASLTAHLIRDAEMSKLPPQLRPNAQKERDKEKEFGSPGQYSSHVGPTASSSSAKTDKTRSEKGKYGDSEYYDVLFEDESRSERFLPSIRAQAPKAKGETYYQRKSSDARKMSDRGRDRGRESGEEKGRPGRQRSNSAESRKAPVFDSESNRAALRVSTSPSPHQHHISKGTNIDLPALSCCSAMLCSVQFHATCSYSHTFYSI
jgi:hypothetical protein